MPHADGRREAEGRIQSLMVAITVRSIPRIVGPLLETTLTIKQLKILTTLAVADSMTMGELAKTFAVSMATMTRIVDRLENQGLVTRVADAADHRVRRLHMTDLGTTVVNEILGARPELGDDVLARLAPDELAALERGLGAVNRQLQAMQG